MASTPFRESMTADGRPAVENIEIDLLLDALYRCCGYDFRSYARASIERRTRQFQSLAGCDTVSEMIPKILYDREFSSRLIRHFSISVTEMFRDPLVYRTVREKVVPLLRTWPHFKVWHAGCATGEEVYSLAIVLSEEGLYDRATIYATDFNDEVLDHAREGIYAIDKLRQATRNYQHSGGKGSFSEYYHARYNAAAIDETLKERIVFSNHNLVTDSVFGEMHLVFCRNVLIYFKDELRNRALGILTESLVHGGILCLGSQEHLRFTAVADRYAVMDDKARIFKKTAGASSAGSGACAGNFDSAGHHG